MSWCTCCLVHPSAEEWWEVKNWSGADARETAVPFRRVVVVVVVVRVFNSHKISLELWAGTVAASPDPPPSLPSSVTRVGDFCTLGNFLQPFATMNLPKSPTFLGNFSKGAKIIHFSNEIIFGNFYRHLAIFIWSRCSLPTMQHHQKVNNRHSLHLSQNNQKFEGSNLSLSFTQRVFPLHRYIFWPSVTRLGDFWKFLGQFSYKIGPNICWPLGMAILKQHPFWSKSCWVYLLSNF